MFGGTPEPVTLWCENHLAGIVIERFGTEPTFFKEADGEHFTVTVRVVPCDLFYAWVMGFKGKMKIISPQSAKDELKQMAQAVLEGLE
jgi:predicted DNA-binding transcriptional regulator YafY